MRIAIGADKRTKTTDLIVEHLKKQKYKLKLFGDLKDGNKDWVNIAKNVALEIKKGNADEGILFCWTGTGVAMVASKIPGVRAVTVNSKKIARDARAWDHGNVICMSCFISPKKAIELVNIWFKTPYSKDEDDLYAQKQIRLVEKLNEG